MSFVNNRMRRQLATAIAALKLVSPDRADAAGGGQAVAERCRRRVACRDRRGAGEGIRPRDQEPLSLTQASIQLDEQGQERRASRRSRACREQQPGAPRRCCSALLEQKGGSLRRADAEGAR